MRGLDVLCVRVVASHVRTLLLFFTYVELCGNCTYVGIAYVMRVF